MSGVVPSGVNLPAFVPPTSVTLLRVLVDEHVFGASAVGPVDSVAVDSRTVFLAVLFFSTFEESVYQKLTATF